MTTYQAMVYSVTYVDDVIGWDYTGDVLFESLVYDDPSRAMHHLNSFEPPERYWFETFRTIEDGEIIDEQIINTSVINFPWYKAVPIHIAKK